MYVNLIIISELCRNFNNYSIPIAVCKVFLTCQRKKERKKETARSLSLFSTGKLLLDRSLFLAAQQRADAEGDLLLLCIKKTEKTENILCVFKGTKGQYLVTSTVDHKFLNQYRLSSVNECQVVEGIKLKKAEDEE